MAEMTFRDGKREIPDYVADVLRRYEERLYQITWAEAQELMNRTLLTDFVNQKFDNVIQGHFRVGER